MCYREIPPPPLPLSPLPLSPLPFSPTHTYTNTFQLSLSLSFTHTHTHMEEQKREGEHSSVAAARGLMEAGILCDHVLHRRSPPPAMQCSCSICYLLLASLVNMLTSSILHLMYRPPHVFYLSYVVGVVSCGCGLCSIPLPFWHFCACLSDVCVQGRECVCASVRVYL